MNKLVQDLQRDHAELISILNVIKELGIGTAEGQQKLLSLRVKLLNHLEKEDLHMYPVLHAAAKTNEKLQQILDNFAKEMGEITNFASYFFSTYQGKELGFDFARDTGKLFAALNSRIINEETVLYREFERIQRR